MCNHDATDLINHGRVKNTETLIFLQNGKNS